MIGRRLWRFNRVPYRVHNYVRHLNIRRWSAGCFGIEPLVDATQGGQNGFILVLYWTGWPYSRR